jgi:hypothetical protein
MITSAMPIWAALAMHSLPLQHKAALPFHLLPSRR